MLWPGVAEELLASKAWFVRDGVFKDVDICLFAHVSSNFTTGWGFGGGNGLVSVEYTFRGESAHSASAPWRGRSALDAVELMNIGWNYRREHLRIQQRSHYVVTNGGDQPNVVPSNATVWYYFRETEYPRIKEMWDFGNKMAEGAALMTSTTFTSRILGRRLAAALQQAGGRGDGRQHQARSGMPAWSEDDQKLARALQKEIGAPMQKGLDLELDKMEESVKDEDKRGGGSDDIGDVSWNVPTVTLRYPSNIPGLPGHNWANAIAMATPIAHKGVVAGAKAQAMTIVDLLTRPELVQAGVGLLQHGADEGRQVHAVSRTRHGAADVVECRHAGAVSAGDEEAATTIRRATRRISSSSGSRIRPFADRVLEHRELAVEHAIGVRVSGERPRAHVGHVGFDRGDDLIAELRVLLDETREVAGGQAEEIVPHEDLAVAAGARANPDGRDAQGVGDTPGDLGRHRLEDHGKTPRGLERARVVQQASGAGRRAALRVVAAEHRRRLRREPEMSHHRHAGGDNRRRAPDRGAGALHLDLHPRRASRTNPIALRTAPRFETW